MKLSSLLFLFALPLAFFVTSCTTPTAEREPASPAARPVHHIFLIHGITGDQTHFGYMKEALAAQLPKLNSNYKYEITPFEYETASDTKDVFEFASDLNDKFSNYFAKFYGDRKNIGANDKISIVCHSQGGIIMTIWLVRLFSSADRLDQLYAQHVDSFVTLGTPFWGSKLASFVRRTLRLGKTFGYNLDPLKIYGDKQLLDMSFNSNVIYDFRKSSTDPTKTPTLERMRNRVRTLNVAGVVKEFSKHKVLAFMKHLSIGKDDYEDDTAVPLPSARLDFIYGSFGRGYAASKASNDLSSFHETHYADFDVVDAVHILPPVLLGRLQTLSQVGQECISDSNCRHPTFGIVVNHLLGLSQATTPLTPTMTSFILDLTIASADGASISESEIDVKVKTPSNVKIGEWSELYSKGVTRLTRDEKKLGPIRAYFTGYVGNSFVNGEFETQETEVTITAKGYKTRVLKVPAKATFTTFADILLEK